jgi:hypothetical protein
VVTTYAATAQAPSTPASQPPRRCRLVLPQPPRAPDSLAWRLQFALAAYAAAAEGKRIEPKRETGARGTLKWVMEQYQRSGKWAEFKPATRKRRENIFRHVIAKAVDKPYAAISRKMMVESRDVARATPAQANVMLKVMRALFDWATEAEHMETNPAKGVPFLKVKGDGFTPGPTRRRIALRRPIRSPAASASPMRFCSTPGKGAATWLEWAASTSRTAS